MEPNSAVLLPHRFVSFNIEREIIQLYDDGGGGEIWCSVYAGGGVDRLRQTFFKVLTTYTNDDYYIYSFFSQAIYTKTDFEVLVLVLFVPG